MPRAPPPLLLSFFRGSNEEIGFVGDVGIALKVREFSPYLIPIRIISSIFTLHWRMNDDLYLGCFLEDV
jgi:hypothetical protein